MADIFRQMQKIDCKDGSPRGGRRRPYGCPCCRNLGRNRFKKYSRHMARVRLKRIDDEYIGTRH